ncbi:S-layer homology domain-containing protein [Peptoniphilus asaccharolyticus]
MPVCVATGNYATSASDSSWDRYSNNALNMTDTGNVTRTAAHEDAIAVASSRNTVVEFNGVKIGGKDMRYAQIGAFFDKESFNNKEYDFIYLGNCQDEDIAGKEVKGKIVVMARIFSTERKYAFQKVKNKGAVGVVVVNTVSYYNRDDWENVPAMGYEQDERTQVQVFSVSGYDGRDLWDMITGKQTTVDEKQQTKGDYRIDMKAFDAHKPAIGQEKRLPVEFLKDKIKWGDDEVPAGSTSWGPRTDLLLKPDVSAPGKNIYSTLNVINDKSTYQYMSGTSMATPVVSASTVLIRPRLKQLEQDPLIKGSGIDLVSLTKIMLQNTARPMIDPTTKDEKGNALYASPRQQGAGIIDVNKALKNNVIVSVKAKGGDGTYNDYGSASLREIKGGAKDFTISLKNVSDRDLTFNVSASPVTTDGETPVKKLDEEYKDEKSQDGQKIVAEIHPKKVDDAHLNLAAETITVPAHSSYNLAAKMEIGKAKDQFVESFITFESKEAADSKNENAQPSLSMPVMGFAGDWNKETIIDKWAWEDGSKSKGIVGYDDEGNLKRPGTMNRGRGGEHGIDLFNPAGVIQNTEDGNPNFEQDPDFFSLNNKDDFDNQKSTGDSKIVDGYTTDKMVTPTPLILRSAYDAKVAIVNQQEEAGQRNLKVLSVQQFIKGILNCKSNTAKGLKKSKMKVFPEMQWDGKVYSPKAMQLNGKYIEPGLTPLAEGQYYYKFQYRLTPDYPYQESYIPVKVDNTAPKIISVDCSEPDEIKVVAKDTYHQNPDKSKTWFNYDQKQHPEAFEEVSNKLWFLGASFVDEDGDLIKEPSLKVLNKGYDATTGETLYVIKGANSNLQGKTLELAALDGATNFSDTFRVKFDQKLTDGKLKYEVNAKANEDENDYKADDKYVIDGGKLKTTEKLENKPAEEKQEDDKKVEGTPEIVLDKAHSTTGNLEDSDLRNVVKPKTYNKYDFVSGEEKPYTDYGDYNNELDADGNPKFYEDGTDMVLAKETMKDLEAKGYVGKIAPDKDGGFRVSGTLKNVSNKAKLYYQSATMMQTNKKEQVMTFGYDEKADTMSFDFYGNKDDVNNDKGINFERDIKLFVEDKHGKSQEIYFRMPETKKKDQGDKKVQNPVESKVGDIEELDNGDLKSKVTPDTDVNGKPIYRLREELKIYKGYAVKITSLNPGKNGLKPLGSNVYYSDASKCKQGQDFSLDDTVRINILQGFNHLNYKIYKIDLDQKGNAKMVNGKVELKEDNLISEKGKCVYFDKEAVQLDMDKNFFNPTADSKLYVRKSPLVMKGVIGDKGGFNWHLRINESIVDEYLIYGDLKSDNSRPFEVKIPFEDGDRMDWAAKDYSGNGMPGDIKDSEGNIIQRALKTQYYLYLDDVKPTVAISKDPVENSQAISYGTDKKLYVDVTDKRTNGQKGEIQEKEIFVNGKTYIADTNLEKYGDAPYEIKVVAKDYARNTTVKIVSFDPQTETVKEKENPMVSIAILPGEGNGTMENMRVNQGEDFALPECTLTAPTGKVFAGWRVEEANAFTDASTVHYHNAGTDDDRELNGLRQPGEVVNPKSDIAMTAIFKNAKPIEKVTVNFEKAGGQGMEQTMEVEKGSTITLPQNGLQAPAGKVFEGWLVSGELMQPGAQVTINDNMTITAMWKDTAINPDTGTKPDPGTNSGSSGSSQNWFHSTPNRGSASQDPTNGNKAPQIKGDFTGHWAEAVIRDALKKGYFNNIAGDAAFKPDLPVTRAQFVTVLARYAKVDTSKYQAPTYKDVDAGDFTAPYIAWAAENKIVLGVGDNRFAPNKTLDRAEMATILYRYTNTLKIQLKETKQVPQYTDFDTIPSWAQEAVMHMSRYEILQGNEDKTFAPKGNFTRAQLAKVIYQFGH